MRSCKYRGGQVNNDEEGKSFCEKYIKHWCMLGEGAVSEKSQICVTSFINAPNLQGYALLDLQWGSEHRFSNGRLQGRCGMVLKNRTIFHNQTQKCPVSMFLVFKCLVFGSPLHCPIICLNAKPLIYNLNNYKETALTHDKGLNEI